ncbi:MAG: hypothetical protein GYA21_01480 [Myxococcales bacterium]|nr:hypothetical protein [Myxococcales bacterium]
MVDQPLTQGPTDDPFSGEKCSVLVFYAVDKMEDEPDRNTPSLVLEPHWSHLIHADTAPYLTELTSEQFLEELQQAGQKATWYERQVINRIREWFLSQQKPAVLYELEPPSIAGSGMARKLGLERERSG